MSAEELDNLVGRIALYPDDLVAIILPASTNPLQIVQADRFLDKRKSDPKLPIDDKWDDSVKALVNYPDVVKMMSGDLDWTSALGEAVVADQGAVMEAIQTFRRRAQAAGNLKSNDKQVVNVEKTVIEIVPANPEVIYVPQYNPTTVVVAGAPAWGYYPTPYPVYYYPYPPGAAFATGLIWGAAIGAAWGGARWGTNWGGGDININRNTNISTGNINRGNVNAGNRPGAGGGTSWKPDKRPGQVSGATGRTNTTGRVGDARGGSGAGSFGGASAAGARSAPASGSLSGGGNRPSTTQAGGMGGGGNRPSTTQAGGMGGGGAGAANRAGSVSASPRDNFGGSGASRGGSGGGSALGGYGSGRQTSMDSSRGASSRSSMSGGGGARGGGGGGGGARGGGGGGRGGGGRR
jgi:hypothetical protein